jgi:alkylhydroperoxidase family enzyme
MPSNDRAGVVFKQPTNTEERLDVAKQCCSKLEMSMPLLVDAMDDRVGHAYSGMPDRLYLIDRAGRVAYKGGRGPFGFKPGELEQAILLMRLEEETTAPPPTVRPAVLTTEQAWKYLPPAEKGAGQPLPAWARVLAPTLPRTTAAMLELDYLQRAKNPLDPVLRAKVREAAAQANHCAYAVAEAQADLRRAVRAEVERLRPLLRLTDGEAFNLTRRLETTTQTELPVLAFAHKLTVAANTVTDDEVREVAYVLGEAERVRRGVGQEFPPDLQQRLGEEQLVALVLTLAYANFQDRLLLSVGLNREPGGPLPPRDLRFVPPAPTKSPGPAAREPDLSGVPRAEDLGPDALWSGLDFGQLQQRLEAQRERAPRIRVPAWEEVAKRLPGGSPRRRPLKIRWSLVCLGYQPELASAWFTCLGTFAQEAHQDRVFEESLFWVITRSLECFY